MNYFTFSWLIAACSFIILFLMHLLWCRLHPENDSLSILNKLFIIFLPIVCILGYFGFHKFQDAGITFIELTYPESLFHAIITSFILLFICLAFYAAVDHSVRIRIFIELSEAYGTPIHLREILKRYNPRAATINRIEKMLVSGYIAKDDFGNYVLTHKGKYFAKFAIKVKNLFKVGIGGGLE